MAGKSEGLARAVWLAAFFGPPAVAAALWRHAAGHHLALGVVLCVTYEAILAVARFAGGVTGDLKARWQKRVADAVDLALQRRISRFDQKYRVFVLAGLRFIDQKGLATVGPFTPELNDVFVDVSLAHRPPHQVKEGLGLLPDLEADVTERRALNEFLDQPNPRVLAVIGAPGSGKTTLLRHTARQVCQRRRGRRGQERCLPILLYLRDHAAAISADPDITLTGLLRSTLGELRATEPDGWFEQQLANGECLVLLDGLDEVARSQDRMKVAAWVERQIRQYPRNNYVITSRPHGYRAAQIDGAEVLQVRGFTAEQIGWFVHGWYLAAERHSTGATDEDITVRARREAGDLLERLDRTTALYDLAANPLLLTMIANVHRYRGALPGSRADLYSEVCQVMLWRRQEAKRLPIQLAGDKKEAVLRKLAYAMMQRRLSDLPQEDVLAEVSSSLRRLPRHVTAEDFLADIGSNGLLVERGNGLYCFAHHTLQEYLAAAYIHDKGLADVLAKVVADPWWRETTLLYAARADADPIVAACLDSGTVTALALAFECADQGSWFAEDLRNRLEGLLAEISNPTTDQERRHLITAVLLSRHLNQQIRARNGTRICTRPITEDLYRLFRDDTQTPLPDGPLPTAVGTGPALGMRASDARAFCRWVNTVIGGEAAYRLPSRAALEDPGVQRPIDQVAPKPPCSIWIESGVATPELWVPSGTRHPHQVDAATLTTHLNSDITRSVPILSRLLLMRSAVGVGLFASYSAQSPVRGVRSQSLDRIVSLALIRARTRTSLLAGAPESERALALAVALDLAPDLVLAELTRDLDPELNLSLPRDLARTLARYLAHALGNNLDRTRGLAHALALDRDIALTPTRDELHSEFTHAQELVLAHDFTGHLNSERAINSVLEMRYSQAMGRVLSQALSETLHSTGQTSDWPAGFFKAFSGLVGISRNGYVVSPETLPQGLADAVQVFRETPVMYGSKEEPTWAANVSRRLELAALPIFNRQQRLTRNAATSIRLAALCLGAEADARNQHESGEAFRKIAAGVTLLERRADGDDPGTEMIILASD